VFEKVVPTQMRSTQLAFLRFTLCPMVTFCEHGYEQLSSVGAGNFFIS